MGNILPPLSVPRGGERKRQRLAEEEMQESVNRSFQAYGRPIVTSTSFKYLGWVLMVANDNWPEVVGNLWKAWNIWAWLVRILGWEGNRPQVLGVFSKAVVQAVFTWVLTPRMRGSLGRF